MPNVKGVVLIARKEFVEDEYGRADWAKVVEALEEPHRSVLRRPLLSFSWYPFETNQALDIAICRLLAEGDKSIFRRLGRFSAEKNLSSVHSTFVRGETPHSLLETAAPILRTYYDEGERVYERTGPQSCILTTRGDGCFSRSDCETNLGWFERAVEIQGGKNVRVREPRCRGAGADRCEYHIEWD